jgi:hypothetical protein
MALAPSVYLHNTTNVQLETVRCGGRSWVELCFFTKDHQGNETEALLLTLFHDHGVDLGLRVEPKIPAGAVSECSLAEFEDSVRGQA